METEPSSKLNGTYEQVSKSLEDCNDHYRGMLEVYLDILPAIQTRNIDAVERKLKDMKSDDGGGPHELGLSDGIKNIKRILEEIGSEQMTFEEIEMLLSNEIGRLEALTR